jgi:phosphoribosylaminoimidazolecarboxamide formyltransferase/IMP cyclohydrolase
MGVEIISTGGTARFLEEAGLKVTPVQEVTDSPEMLGGRVKTLHPRIHGGILARRDESQQLKELAELGINLIDMVVVNLYPFAQTVAAPGCTLELALENIDIGGPTMLRAAAKNFPAVIPVCNPQDYPEVAAVLQQEGDLSATLRQKLAAKAFAHTAAYDAAITGWLQREEPLPEQLALILELGSHLRYGENPHQEAALYKLPAQPDSLAWAQPLQGKELSYNNYNDADAAFALGSEFNEPAAVAVKHAVPCGVGLGNSPAQAFARAQEADPISIFGGIIAFNRPVDAETAKLLQEIFLEVIIAPAFTPEAKEVLAAKKNLRLLACPNRLPQGHALRSISGGVLVQQADAGSLKQWQAAGSVQPPQGWEEDGRLAWLTAKYAKSNAIVVSKGGMTLGIGSGCTSRIDAANIALAAAGERAPGAVMASDGFIPFPDVVEAAAKAGISVILQPGGSKGDDKAIAAADKAGIAMLFTGIRHFRH